MKRTFKKRILSLLCVGLLLSTPHTIAYAATDGTESTLAQTEKSEPCAKTPSTAETAPSLVETTPTVETAPLLVETTPTVETALPQTETPPTTKTPPLTEETLPTEVTALPPTEGATPPTEGATPPTEGATPPTEGTPPSTEETTLPTEGTPPLTEKTPPTEIIPQTEAAPSETTPSDKPLTDANTEQTTYGVEIAWDSLKFDCVPIWNPEKHCYDDWESTGNLITVTNTSKNGAPIRVTLTFVPMDKMGATAAFAPCEGDLNPDDFTFSDGQVTFLLPRDANSNAQATVNLFLTGDPIGRETQQYNQIGSIKTEFTPLNEDAQPLETVPTDVSDIQPPPLGDLPLPKQEPSIVEKTEGKPTEPSQPEILPAEPSLPEILPTEPSLPEILPAEPSLPEILPAEPSLPEILPAEPSLPEILPTEPSLPEIIQAEPSLPEPETIPPPTAEGTPPEIKAEKPSQDSTANAVPPPIQNLNEEANTAPHTESVATPQEELP